MGENMASPRYSAAFEAAHQRLLSMVFSLQEEIPTRGDFGTIPLDEQQRLRAAHAAIKSYSSMVHPHYSRGERPPFSERVHDAEERNVAAATVLSLLSRVTPRPHYSNDFREELMEATLHAEDFALLAEQLTPLACAAQECMEEFSPLRTETPRIRLLVEALIVYRDELFEEVTPETVAPLLRVLRKLLVQVEGLSAWLEPEVSRFRDALARFETVVLLSGMDMPPGKTPAA